MGLTRKQRLFVEAVVSDPTKPLIECAKEAGYSKKRLSETATELKNHAEVQAAIAEILNKKLETAPSAEGTYRTVNEVKEMCRRNGDSSWAASTC
jgi:phage terminase small subunit